MPSPLLTLARRWMPYPATGALLVLLAALVALLRAQVVSPKPLQRAIAHWNLAHGPHPLPFKWEDAAVLGTHFASLLALAVLALALLTLRWWHPPAPSRPAPSRPTSPTSPSFRPARLAILLLAAALRLPLASGSLWWDELWNIKFATVGEWRPNPLLPDAPTFLPSSWARAAWYYNKPTNHPVLTLPSKLSHNLWSHLQNAPPGQFSEIALRLPVLLASLATVALAALLAQRLAGPRAGILTALLFALHPWFIRYGVDARSYSLAIFFMTAALYAIERATAPSGPSRRWWWLAGLCQFLLMWAHVLSHFSLALALAAAATWLIYRQPGPDRSRRLAQWGLINLIAAALLLVAFLPNLLQAATWGQRNDDGNLLTPAYLLRTLSQVLAGMDPLTDPGPAALPQLSVPALLALSLSGAAAALAGARFLLRHQTRSAIVFLTSIALSAAFLLTVNLCGFYFYHRFLLAASLPLLLLVAIGLSRARSPLLPAAALTLFAFLTFPQTLLLLTRSYAPFRETAADLRAAGGPNVLPVGYGLGSHVLQAYLPSLRDIRSNSAASLQALIDEARRDHRPLLLALGYEALNRRNQPEGFPLLDNPALFETISTRHGIEPEFTFHLLRLKPLAPSAVSP